MSAVTYPQSSSIVAAPPKPVSKEEILQEIKTHQRAEEAKVKPKSERTLGDKIAIASDFINGLPEPIVCYGNGVGNKLNVVA